MTSQLQKTRNEVSHFKWIIPKVNVIKCLEEKQKKVSRNEIRK